MRQFVETLLSYLFMGVVVLAFALTTQVIFEWSTAGLKWNTVGAFAATTLLAIMLHYLQLLFQDQESRHERPRSLKLAAGAASLFAGVALAFVFQGHLQAQQLVTTGASQWHHGTLSDGTAIHVDARSRIEIAYTDDERIVYVREGGAVFDVAKDPKRPFIARTHLIDAVAVGTRFGVSIDSGVTTTVSEGIVKVTGRGKADDKTVTLKAGDELRVLDNTLALPHIENVNADRKLQWTRGVLVLGGLTVAEGVAELNRRNRTQIVIDSPALGKRVVDFASVKVDAPETYAKVVARERGVTMTVDLKNDVIRLSE